MKLKYIRTFSIVLVLAGIIGVYFLSRQINISYEQKFSLIRNIHKKYLQRIVSNLDKEVKDYARIESHISTLPRTLSKQDLITALPNARLDGKIILDSNSDILYQSGPFIDKDSLSICLISDSSSRGVYTCPISHTTILYSYVNQPLVHDENIKVVFFRTINRELAREISSITSYPVNFIPLNRSAPKLKGYQSSEEIVMDKAGTPLVKMVSYFKDDDFSWLSRLQFITLFIILLQAGIIFTNNSLGKIAGVAQMLKRKNKIINAISRQRETLLHILSHDLRNYITMILGSADLARLEVANNPKLQKWLERIHNAALMESRLIELVNKQAALENGKLNLTIKPLKLQTVIAQAENLFSDQLCDKELNLEVSCHTHNTVILVDEVSFTNNVFNNLLSNAIKFSIKGSTIRIDAAINDKNTCTIKISDQGIGMDDELLNNIWRMDAKTNRIGTNGESGTGFGLPLTRKFIEEFGGTVDVESKSIDQFPEGHGTTIILELPCMAA